MEVNPVLIKLQPQNYLISFGTDSIKFLHYVELQERHSDTFRVCFTIARERIKCTGIHTSSISLNKTTLKL